MEQCIGGYFELELRKGKQYHNQAIRLNTAANCFDVILRTYKYEKVYIPYYTCEIMLRPLKKYRIDYEFYHINLNFEPDSLPQLKNNEAFLYTNYFGLKQSCVSQLANIYSNQLIIDNAQAFFDLPLNGIPTFYSARKIFGVPDGAYLYIDTDYCNGEILQDVSYNRMSHLLERFDLGAECGYADFKTNEDQLESVPVKKMSKLTEALLNNIDYEFSIEQRRSNYLHLDKALHSSNCIKLALPDQAVPMVYPYYTEDPTLRNKLIKNKVFVARYWPNIINRCSENSIEYSLFKNLIPLPIDQRYTKQHMEYIIKLIRT